MKTQFKYLLSNLILVTMTGAMFSMAACGEDETCTTNEDCAVGETCDTETSECVGPEEGCAADADCAEGERCFDIVDGAGSCRAPADCSEQADPNGFCNTQTAGQICDTATKTCVTPEPTDEYRYILIKDVSTGAAACDSNPAAGGSDPGSDIMWVLLNNGDGEELAYGKASKFEEGTSAGDANTYNKPNDVLTGEPLSVDADLCPAEVGGKRFRDDSVVALGCGGKLFVEFVDGDGTNTLIENGFSVEVGEYAQFCNQAGGDPMGSDRYEVYLCLTAPGATPSEADCGTKLTPNALGGILAPVTISISE